MRRNRVTYLLTLYTYLPTYLPQPADAHLSRTYLPTHHLSSFLNPYYPRAIIRKSYVSPHDDDQVALFYQQQQHSSCGASSMRTHELLRLYLTSLQYFNPILYLCSTL